jgi:hypothetical protein
MERISKAEQEIRLWLGQISDHIQKVKMYWYGMQIRM